MATIDLTPFGFTPTESAVYRVLLTGGPGTGYAIARTAGLARANAYSALEGLVAKGAARVDGGRPKRYRPEAPAALIAKISNDHGQALEQLSRELDTVPVPETETLVELTTTRTLLQLLTHEIARARRGVSLLVPPDAFPLLAPALRRPYAAGVSLELASTGRVDLGFAPVDEVAADAHPWPGMPVILVADERSAVVASRHGKEVRGHWSTTPSFVAAARLAFERFRMP